MAIDPRFIVNLKGKDYPVWAGVLDAAHAAGLRSLTTTLIQIPSAENGMTAIVMARAEFEDGRVFEDLGDCSPATTSPQLAAASIRLASTRAKGRVLRDAVNVGQTLLEELPDMDAEPARNGRQAAPQTQQRNGSAHSPQSAPIAPQSRSEAPPERAPIQPQTPPFCEGVTCTGAGCGRPLTKGQYEVSLKAFGTPLCPGHQKTAAAARN